MLKILFLILAVGIAGISGNYIQSAEMNNVVGLLHGSLGVVSNPGELDEIRSAVKDFIDLRKHRNSEDAKIKATELDQRLNSLELVRTHCTESISTLDLAFESDPYEKLQQICPILKNLTFSRAVQLFTQFDN